MSGTPPISLPNWVPSNLPGNFPFTATRDGWVRWYKGKTRFVCGRLTPIAEVENRWIEKKQAIDRGSAVRVGGVSVIELCGLFLGHSHGSTFLDNYLERVGVDRIREAVGAVWRSAFSGV